MWAARFHQEAKARSWSYNSAVCREFETALRADARLSAVNSIPQFCAQSSCRAHRGDVPPDPGIPPGQRKTAGRAATLHGGPHDSLTAYQRDFYGSSEIHASAICAGGVA
jgi:hypothetical protein